MRGGGSLGFFPISLLSKVCYTRAEKHEYTTVLCGIGCRALANLIESGTMYWGV